MKPKERAEHAADVAVSAVIDVVLPRSVRRAFAGEVHRLEAGLGGIEEEAPSPPPAR